MTLKIKKYGWNLLIAIDQLINTIFFGDPDETLSSRMGKHEKDCKVCFYICMILNLFQKEHCIKSEEPDEGGNESI